MFEKVISRHKTLDNDSVKSHIVVMPDVYSFTSGIFMSITHHFLYSSHKHKNIHINNFSAIIIPMTSGDKKSLIVLLIVCILTAIYWHFFL